MTCLCKCVGGVVGYWEAIPSVLQLNDFLEWKGATRSFNNKPWEAWGDAQSITIPFHYMYKNSNLYIITFLNHANANGKIIVYPENAPQINCISMKHGTLLMSHSYQTDIHLCGGNIFWMQSHRYLWESTPSILSIHWQIIFIQKFKREDLEF